jgi:AbrB family looped-hinge helix DNA binding protein
MQPHVEFSVSVLKNGRSLRITVPRALSEYLGLQKGDKVRIFANDDELILRKKQEN